MRRIVRWLATLVLLASSASAATREVYVWQRQFDDEVVAALRAFQPQIDRACVLVAEVSWKGGAMDVVRPTVDFRALAELGRPVGLAVRIGTYGGAFARDDATAGKLVALVRACLAEAKAAGLRVAELQIDYDCAESKLAGYRRWVSALRPAVAPTPLVITALPVWLKHAEFRALAADAGGYVLQVHSLERPTGPDAAFTLCDPVRALAWARQADAIGVPFRVALPTYGYVLGFDGNGKFIGMVAEGHWPTWPRDTRLRVVRADAVAMARLAADITTARLSHCTGVIWFRLPVPRDRMNWAAETFAAVLRGEVPESRLTVVAEWSEGGLAEIAIVNRGQTTELVPPQVALRWAADARVLAADGLNGFRLELRGGEAQGIVRAIHVPADAAVAPGGKVIIAWLRFAHEISLEVSLPVAP